MSKILGIDEVGRGPWAGPLVVGAVVLPDDFTICHPELVSGSRKLNDSKKLSAKKRAILATEIKKCAASIGVGWVSAATIDKIGLSAALKLAARRAVAQIDCDYDEIVIDGTIKLIDDERVTTLPRADSLISAVSAASIVAKVARDEYMARLDRVFPNYGLAEHVGYGTAAHLAAIEKFGVLPIHRRSFAPIASFAGLTGESRKSRIDSPTKSANDKPTTTFVGKNAENVAAEFLRGRGHEIIAQNWKTKYCEVDIISSRDETIYFTEVKYRRNDQAGGGIDAINEKKENQMKFAARFYLESNELNGKVDAMVSAISLTGNPPQVEIYIEDVR